MPDEALYPKERKVTTPPPLHRRPTPRYKLLGGYMYRETLTFDTPGRGLHEITRDVSECLGRSSIVDGVLHLFVLHTSASLVIQENADASA